MNSYTFTIDGPPKPKGRPRFRSIGKFVQVYTDAATLKHERMVADKYLSDQNHPPLIESPMKLRIIFYMPIPKSINKRIHRALIGKPHTRKPDADNLEKSVNDSLNAIAFRDDALIWSVETTKVYDENPRTEVTLMWEDSVYDFNIGKRRLFLHLGESIIIDNVIYKFVGIKNIGDNIPNIPCIYINDNKVYVRGGGR